MKVVKIVHPYYLVKDEADWFYLRRVTDDQKAAYDNYVEPSALGEMKDLLPKDELDHALDVYRNQDVRDAGITFEEALQFVRAVDQEADRRKLKAWLEHPNRNTFGGEPHDS